MSSGAMSIKGAAPYKTMIQKYYFHSKLSSIEVSFFTFIADLHLDNSSLVIKLLLSKMLYIKRSFL